MIVRLNASVTAKRALTVSLMSLAFGVLSGCQPNGTSPGLWLRGELVAHRVTDWAFTDEYDEIYIQTTTRYVLPHSNTIWCVEEGGDLFIGSYNSGTDHQMVWVGNIQRDPEARLKINDKLYDVSLKIVEDEQHTAALYDALQRKYQMEEAFENRLGTWWFYSVEQVIEN